jgi:hypothetical protein
VISKSRVNRASKPPVDKRVKTIIDRAGIATSALNQSVPPAISHAAKAVLAHLLISHFYLPSTSLMMPKGMPEGMPEGVLDVKRTWKPQDAPGGLPGLADTLETSVFRACHT